MTLGPIEIIAIIIILFSIIKLIVFWISPRAWLNFAGKFYVKPNITSAVSFVFAAIVLYYLIDSGMTIVQILAAWLFVALIMVIGLAQYAHDIVVWAKSRDHAVWFREQWLLMVIWIGLLAWGIGAIFYK